MSLKITPGGSLDVDVSVSTIQGVSLSLFQGSHYVCLYFGSLWVCPYFSRVRYLFGLKWGGGPVVFLAQTVGVGIKGAHPLHTDHAKPHGPRPNVKFHYIIDIKPINSTPKEGNIPATTVTYQPHEAANDFYMLLPSQPGWCWCTPHGCNVSSLHHDHAWHTHPYFGLVFCTPCDCKLFSLTASFCLLCTNSNIVKGLLGASTRIISFLIVCTMG